MTFYTWQNPRHSKIVKKVFLDGVHVEQVCECVTGKDGWIRRHTGGVTVDHEYELEIVHGKVTVELDHDA